MKNKNFNLRLTEKMKEKNITQADLCRLTGLSTSMVSYYCAGRRVPSMPTVIKIAKALNTTVEYLANGTSMYDNQSDTYSISENKIPYSPAKPLPEHSGQSPAFLIHLLNQEGQRKVISYIEDLLCSGKYS